MASRTGAILTAWLLPFLPVAGFGFATKAPPSKWRTSAINISIAKCVILALFVLVIGGAAVVAATSSGTVSTTSEAVDTTKNIGTWGIVLTASYIVLSLALSGCALGAIICAHNLDF